MLSGAQAARKERILPSGTFELVINLRENAMRIYDAERPEEYRRFSGAILSGPYSRAFVCDANQHESLVGVHFRPGGAFPFLDAAASELADRHVNLADLLGPSAAELRERLCEEARPRQRFRILESCLIERLLHGPSARHPALPAALNLFGPAGTGGSVREITRTIGLSERRFIQVFRTEVGTPPKLFCRLLRFQHARALAQASRSVSWPELAADCGYFDQAHLPDGRAQEPGGWNRVILRVADLPARIEALKKAGLRFRNQMESGPGGKQIQLEDPDGNPLELFEPAR